MEFQTDRSSNETTDGRVLVQHFLNNTVASEVKLFFHFSAKWLLLSEVSFQTQNVGNPIEEISDISTFNDASNQIRDENNHKMHQNHNHEADSIQLYIGVGIGVLSMVVIFLMVIVFVVIKKQHHQVFSKHSGKPNILFYTSQEFDVFQCSSAPSAKYLPLIRSKALDFG